MLLVLVLGATPAHAGWVQAPGAYYLKLWDQMLIGGQVFARDGTKLELPESYQDHALRLYFEYGVDEALTVIVRGTPLGLASYGGEATAYSGLMGVGLRAALIRGELPIALELGYGWGPPLGKAPLAEGQVEGRRFVYRPTFEQHVGQVELQIGWAFSALWMKAAGGLVVSSGEGIDPAAEASFRLGTSTSFGLEADAGVVVHAPFADPRFIDVTGVGNTRYVGVALGVGYWITNSLGVRLDLGLAPFAESNAATPSIGVGIQSH